MLKPVDDAVLVEIQKIEEKTAGGIYMSENVVDHKQMEQVEGTLVAVGDFAFFDLIANNKSYPKIGDKVFFKRHSGILHYDDKNNKVYRIIHDQDIYACETDMKVEEVLNG